MRTTTYLIAAVLSLGFLFSTFNCFAQLDTAHWVPPLHAGLNGQIADHYIYLSTPVTIPFTVTIKDGSGAVLATPTISNTTPFVYFVGNGQTSGSPLFIARGALNTVLSNRGLILNAVEPFYVSVRVRSNNQTDWAVSKGMAGLGTAFRFGGFPQFNAGPPVGVGSPSNRNFVMGIMATQNNTTITVSDYNPALTLDGVPIFLAPPSFTITLNQGETYVVAGGTNFAPNQNGFIGALIQADKPIALNNGNMNGTIHPTNTSNQDMGIDLSIPVERLGKEYIFIEGNGNTDMEKPIIIAHQDSTKIYVNGSSSPVTTINAGDFFLVPNSNYQGVSHRNMFIRTSKPVYAYQALAATSSADNDGGLVLVPPFSCFLPDSIDLIPFVDSIGSTPYSTALLVTTELGATVQVNGVPLSNPEPVLGTNWETYKTNAISGNVKITSTGGVTASVLGVASPAGFAGYFSGFSSIPLASDFSFTDTCFSSLTTFNASFDTQFNPDSIGWNFGDPTSAINNTATGLNVAHIFTSPGTYAVQMVVFRCQNDTITKTVTIGNCANNLLASFVPTTLTVCQGDSITFTDNSTSSSGITNWNWTFNGGLPNSAAIQGPHAVAFNTAGVFNITLQISDGVTTDDTTIIITVNPTATGTDVITSCTPITWIDGNNYSASTNTPMDTIFGGAANGCDSIVTLDLTINSTAIVTDVQTICGNSFTWIDGVTYSSSTNVPTFTILGGAANGCDSIITLNLTLTTPTKTTNVFNECEGFSVTVGTNTYATTGVFTDVVNNCDTIITDLTINPAPQLTLIKVDDNCGENSGSVTAIAQTNNPPIIYSWSTGATDSVINNLPSGTYSLIIVDANGCTDTAQTFVEETSIDCEQLIFIPNVFSPNGDSQNDVFITKLIGVEFENLKIYNRWGILLFETDDANEGWDGTTTSGEEASDGTYFFILSYKNDNEKRIEKGTLTLLR